MSSVSVIAMGENRGVADCSIKTEMISAAEALGMVLKVAQRLPAITVPIYEAIGKVLAEDIRAPDPLPPYPASVKDGYAVIASDGPGEYPVITESRAGNDGLGVTVNPGSVAYVTTGGPIPDGADAVVQVEDTAEVKDDSSESKRIKILVQTSKGVDIRPVGFDIEKDTIILKSGEKVGSSEIGLLATAGVMAVKVYPTPIIGVLSTGDELVEPTTAYLSRGQIRDSNRAMIVAAAMQEQCKVVDLGIARDDEEELDKILSNAFSSGINILLTSGGVSMGDRDFIKPLLQKKGTVYFSKVNMRPGKPLTFAEIDLKSTENITNKVLAFGLPGNPVSSIVCFHLFVVPAIRQLAGWANPNLMRVHARLQQPIKTNSARPEFHRAVIRWKLNDGSGNSGFVAESTGHQTSSRLSSMKSANALLELPATGDILSTGTVVSAIVISDLCGIASNDDTLSSDSTTLSKVISSSILNGDGLVPAEFRVAVLTVSDTVASGAGPDRRIMGVTLQLQSAF